MLVRTVNDVVTGVKTLRAYHSIRSALPSYVTIPRSVFIWIMLIRPYLDSHERSTVIASTIFIIIICISFFALTSYI